MQLDRVSNSRLDAFANCPYHAFLRYVKGLPNLVTPAGLVGVVLHDVFYRYLVYCRDNGVEGSILTFDAILEDAMLGVPPEQQPEIQEIGQYFRDRFRFDPKTIAGIELELAIDEQGNAIPYTEARGFRGKLDLVLIHSDGTVEVVDWKTGWIPPKAKTLDKDQQLWRYALLVLAKWRHVKKLKLRLEYLRLRRTYEVELDIEVLLKETLPSILRQWQEINRKLQHYKLLMEEEYTRLVAAGVPEEDAEDEAEEASILNAFPATPGSQCSFCSYACPLQNTPSAPVRPRTPEEARKLMAEIVAFEAGVRQRMFFLQQYCGQYEHRVEYAGRFWSIESSTSNEYNFDQLKREARALGYDPDQLLRPPTAHDLDQFLADKEVLRTKLTIRPKYGDPDFQGRKRRPKSWEVDDETKDTTEDAITEAQPPAPAPIRPVMYVDDGGSIFD